MTGYGGLSTPPLPVPLLSMSSLPETVRSSRAPVRSYLHGLNPEQAAAVAHVDGPALVLAGAGSGKTRVLTARIANLIHQHDVLPEQILAVTFTNKAAKEMKTRIERFVGEAPRDLWAGTFHAFGANLLRQYAKRLGWERRFSIFDSDDSARVLKRILQDRNDIQDHWELPKFRNTISDAKNALVSPARFLERAQASEPYLRVAGAVYQTYQDELKRQNAFDFDDLLVKPVELLRSEQGRDVLRLLHDRYRYLLVDEYQDTNQAQYALIRLLADKRKNLMVVGDDDQSIYGWRGATITNILNFERDFPGANVVRLEQNYRSTGTILAAANAVIGHNTQRKGKTLRTDGAPGDKIVVAIAQTEYDEARWMAQEIERHVAAKSAHSCADVAILYRTNAQSRSIEEALRRKNLPYQIVSGLAFYERKEIKDAMSYLKLITNPRDEGAFTRIVNTPRRGIGEKSVEVLLAYARQHDMGLVDAAGVATMIPGIPKAGASALVQFHTLMADLYRTASTQRLGTTMRALVEGTGLIAAAEREGDEGLERLENLRELIVGASEFEADHAEDQLLAAADPLQGVTQFLERATLQAQQDQIASDAGLVTLMTIHAAKGLEFPVVFVGGMEDGLFPHERTQHSPEQLEEERRLFYVAMTRAERRLFLSLARERRRGRDTVTSTASPFLDEIPIALRELRHLTMSHDQRYGTTPSWRAAPLPQRRSARPSATEDDSSPDDGGDYDADAGTTSVSGRTRTHVPARTGNATAPRFFLGEEVRHPAFGDGVVVALHGAGPDQAAEIEFDDDSTRTFCLPNPKLTVRPRR
jgi:DNA helicase-2/ATP-dependent DNA helicase PcrA